MLRQRRRCISILMICVLLTVMSGSSFAAENEIGYYAGENGRFSLELAENGFCYWYQDGNRYAGRYEQEENGYLLRLVGGGTKGDTDFQAEILEDGSLKIDGGVVYGERFIKTEKPQDILSIDQLWSARIGKKRASTGRIRLTETVLMDWEGIRVSATGYTANGNQEAVRLLLENNGEDEVTLQLADLKVNDRSIEPLFYERLAAHEKHGCTLDLGVALLEAAGVETVETISMAFDVQKDYTSVFTSEPTSIPVQDSRTRVPVLIPLYKPLLLEYHLGIGLIGYENNGTSINLYYSVQNEADNEFEFCFRDARINGERPAAYIGNKAVKENSSGVYCVRIYRDDYSGIGTLKELELSVDLEKSYSSFVSFGSISMEFERSGQMCGFKSEMEIKEDSEFWQENFVQPNYPIDNTETTGIPPVHTALNGDRIIYVVDLKEGDAITAAFSVLGVYTENDDFGSDADLAVFRFLNPIENCLYFSVPFKITADDDSDFSDVEWKAVAYLPNEKGWAGGAEYPYIDDTYADAVIVFDEPMTIDTISVVPVAAPNGYGAFDVEAAFTKALIGFPDQASAQAFAQRFAVKEENS